MRVRMVVDDEEYSCVGRADGAAVPIGCQAKFAMGATLTFLTMLSFRSLG